MTLDPEDAEELEEVLARYEGLDHLRVKKRGDSLTILSGDGADPNFHARITHLGRGEWGLSLPHPTGRWEKTPFRGPMNEVIETVVTNLPFYLDDPTPQRRKTLAGLWICRTSSMVQKFCTVFYSGGSTNCRRSDHLMTWGIVEGRLGSASV